MARATSSFPVPLAPVINTFALLEATRPMSLKTSSMRGLFPTIAVVGNLWRRLCWRALRPHALPAPPSAGTTRECG